MTLLPSKGRTATRESSVSELAAPSRVVGSLASTPRDHSARVSAGVQRDLIDALIGCARQHLMEFAAKLLRVADGDRRATIKVGEMSYLVEDAPAGACGGPAPLFDVEVTYHVVERVLFRDEVAA